MVATEMQHWPSRLLSSFRQRPVTAILLPLFVILAVPFVLKRGSEWQEVYVAAARTLLAGGDMYAGHGYTYPPFAVVLAIPFVPLPHVALRIVWYLVNVASVVVMARSAWELAGGPRLGGIGSTPRREWWIVVVGAMIGGAYMLNAFAHQQNDLVIGAPLMSGCL